MSYEKVGSGESQKGSGTRDECTQKNNNRLDYDSVIGNALEEAYERINKRAAAKSKLFRFQSNSIGCINEVVSKRFVFSCPLTKSYSMSDVKKDRVEEATKVQEESTSNTSNVNEGGRVRRRCGISERNANDRVIFKYAMRSYAAVDNAISFDLI